MCEYVTRNELKQPKEVARNLLQSVQSELAKEGFQFEICSVGSGKRNMVVRKSNTNYFDLDYQLFLTEIPDGWKWNDAKRIKYSFMRAVNNNLPNGFKNCEDSTQAITIKNNKERFGLDVAIVTDYKDELYILYNKKNTNNANNNDYCWEIRKNMLKFKERFSCVEGTEMWEDLRDRYLKKRIKYESNNPEHKKSYQILNEAVVETLQKFGVSI